MRRLARFFFRAARRFLRFEKTNDDVLDFLELARTIREVLRGWTSSFSPLSLRVTDTLSQRIVSSLSLKTSQASRSTE
jgi:hypothetical protein